MKNDKLIFKLILGAFVWTGGFLTVAAFAADKARSEDPQILHKLGDHLQMAGLSRGHILSGDYQPTSDAWTAASPSKSIYLKTISADVSFEVSESSPQVQITANGSLDKNEAPRLLEVESTEKELEIRQPDRDATRGLSIHILVPKSFNQELVVKTVSGDIHISQLKLKSLEASSVSGNLAVKASEIQEVSTKSVSGDVSVENGILAPIDAKSVSGNVKLHLKDGAKATVSVKSVSGNIVNHFDRNPDSKIEVSVKTTSGDISVE